MSTNLSWDEYFMSIASVSALRSKDPSRKVGCCVINPDDKHILAIGYNGFCKGCDDDKLPWTKDGDNWLDTKYPYVCHAEANAIINANGSLKGSWAYVTLYPCHDCAKLIIQSGIKKVLYKDEISSNKFEESKKASKIMFEMAGIVTMQLLPKYDIIIEERKA